MAITLQYRLEYDSKIFSIKSEVLMKKNYSYLKRTEVIGRDCEEAS